jgi:hypothetical protein
MKERLRADLDAGGLAVRMGVQYTPRATRLEVSPTDPIPHSLIKLLSYSLELAT